MLRTHFCRMTLLVGLLAPWLQIAASGRELPADLFPARDELEQEFRNAAKLEDSGDPEAVAAYRRILEQSFPLSDAVQAALGRLLPPAEGAPHWEAVVAVGPESPYFAEALGRLAEARESEGRLEEARVLWARCATAVEDEPASTRALLRVMGILNRTGRGDEAVSVAERIWVERAHIPEAREAETLLASDSGDPFRPVSGARILQRGKVLLEKGRREDAVRTLEELNRRLVPASGLRPEVDLALGKALLYLRRYQETLAPLGRASASPRTEEQARFYRARSLFGLDRGDEGAADLVRLARAHPGSSKAPVYLHQACRVFEGRKMWAEAEQARDLLKKGYPGSDEALENRWTEGWKALRQGRFDEAATVFGSVAAAAGRGWSRARSLYWQARALRSLGQSDQAGRVSKVLVSEFPLGYYARLAAETAATGAGTIRLAEARTEEPRSLPVFLPQAGDLDPEAEASRAAAYLRLRLPGAARRVLGRVKSPALSSARLAYWCEDFGGAVRASGGSWLDWPAGRDPKPMDLAALAYPIAYPSSASRAAQKAGIHPHLLLAVAHTESHFDPDAHSPWEARGLMQFIPATGAAVARAIGLRDFEPEALYDPGIALRLGAQHLRELLDRFGGDVIAAVAAYNAGAGAVEQWRERWGSEDRDVFVECIPYRETRQYVRKVLTALDAYGRLDPPGIWAASPGPS